MAEKPKQAKTVRAAAAPDDPRLLPPDARVAIPPRGSFNAGLSSASEATMLELFGEPGAKTFDCSPATGAFARRVVTQSVGPFRVSGLEAAVKSLKEVFAEAETQIPDVVAKAHSVGMLCVRHKRKNANSFSNHSWGAAIDLRFGAHEVPQGVALTERGCLMLAPFFNKHGWFWGAGFSRDFVDSMHFEVAEETIRAMARG